VKPLSNSSQLLAYRVPICQILESSSGRTPHVARDRSASELRATRQSLGDHNSAPQANQTLRLELSAGPDKLENTFRGKNAYLAPHSSPGSLACRHYTPMLRANQAQAARAEAWGSMRRMQAGAAEDARVAAADEGLSAACLQRMNASASDEAPQDRRRRGVGSLRTCASAAAAPPATAKLLRHAPSGSCPAAPGVWTLACSFGSSRLIKPLIGIF